MCAPAARSFRFSGPEAAEPLLRDMSTRRERTHELAVARARLGVAKAVQIWTALISYLRTFLLKTAGYRAASDMEVEFEGYSSE